MRRAVWWIIGLIALGLTCAALSIAMTRQGATRESYIAFRARHIVGACWEYRENPKSGGKYPATLGDLVKPPWGGPSPLPDSEKDLACPWVDDERFRYALVSNGKGELEPYVWAEWTVDGRTKLIGAKWNGQGVVLFGQ